MLALVGVSAGLLYFLGRLYLDEYYYSLGIARGALSFSETEYMFSCLPVVMMLVGLIPGVYWTYRTFDNWRPFGVDCARPREERRGQVVSSVFTAVSSVFLLSLLFVPTPVPTVVALLAGIAIGALFMPVAWLMQWAFTGTLSRKTEFNVGIAHVGILMIFFLISLPAVAGKLAEQTAFACLGGLPEVIIGYREPPTHLQSSLEGEDQRFTARLLLINDDWVYVLKSKSNNNEEDDGQDELAGSPEVYSVRTSDIAYIIYNPPPDE